MDAPNFSGAGRNASEVGFAGAENALVTLLLASLFSAGLVPLVVTILGAGFGLALGSVQWDKGARSGAGQC
jgi:hypothetical protein